jgi:hypothetical protein
MRQKSSLVSKAVVSFCLVLGGCGGDLANLTASLGGSTAGGRGSVRVFFINNTPHRAVFTVGTYDQTDPDDIPDFSQFGHDEDGLVLEGDEASPIGTLDCARVFSVGGARMLALLAANADADDVLPESAVAGVEFFDVGAESAPVRVGQAPPFEALLGVDFPCNALLILRLEDDPDGAEPFRIDFELLASESTR